MPTPFTLQQVFDRALNGMRAQGYKRAGAYDRPEDADPIFQCNYLAPDGSKCHIGHCIDDPELARRMDNGNFKGIDCMLTEREHPEVNALFEGLDPDVMRQLQRCHDGDMEAGPTADPFEYEASMQRFAIKHGPTYTPPSNSTHQEPA